MLKVKNMTEYKENIKNKRMKANEGKSFLFPSNRKMY